jgi:hypothetical protein
VINDLAGWRDLLGFKANALLAEQLGENDTYVAIALLQWCRADALAVLRRRDAI